MRVLGLGIEGEGWLWGGGDGVRGQILLHRLAPNADEQIIAAASCGAGNIAISTQFQARESLLLRIKFFEQKIDASISR